MLGATIQNVVAQVTCAQDLYITVSEYVLFGDMMASDLGVQHT
jgi:hypothetical protein